MKFGLKHGEKGQIYSLDFLIAAGLLVLGIGMTLGLYENATYSSKEAMEKNELTAIALTASNILLGNSQCEIDATTPWPSPKLNFKTNGYRARGCYNLEKLKIAAKKSLMIPTGTGKPNFACRILIEERLIADAANECQDDPAGLNSPSDVVSIERKVLVKENANALQKKEYDKSQNGIRPQGVYDTAEKTLTFMVWRK